MREPWGNKCSLILDVLRKLVIWLINYVRDCLKEVILSSPKNFEKKTEKIDLVQPFEQHIKQQIE